MNNLKNIIRGGIWTLVGVYVTLVILLQIPAVQDYMGSQVGKILSEKFGTKVTVGQIDLGFMNRIIIDDVHMTDQLGKPMLEATRMSVNVDLIDLLKGKIVITSAQLFGLDANLYKQTANSTPNFQFVIDSLASKDTTTHTPLDLSIGSLIVRHGKVKYDQLDVAPKQQKFSLEHIHVSDISAHVILNTLTDDSLNVNLKKLSFNEEAGLKVGALSFKAEANKQGANLEKLVLKLPHTEILLDSVWSSFRMKDNQLDVSSLSFGGRLDKSKITPSDVSSLVPLLHNFKNPIYVKSSFGGTADRIDIDNVVIGSENNSIHLSARGSVAQLSSTPRWETTVNNLRFSEEGIKFVADNLGAKLNIPEEVTRIGDVDFVGNLGGFGNDISMRGMLKSGIGNAKLSVNKLGQHVTGKVETSGVNLRKLLNNNQFNEVAANLQFDGMLRKGKKPNLKAKGTILKFDYNNYTFNNINLDGSYENGTLAGKFAMDDQNVKIDLSGKVIEQGRNSSANIEAEVRKLNLSALNLTKKWPNTVFDFDLTANIHGNSLKTLDGTLDLNHFVMDSENQHYEMEGLHVEAGDDEQGRFLEMMSDFASIEILGDYDYRTIVQSITNLISDKLPTLPGLPKATHAQDNQFKINATIFKDDWLRELFGIPLKLDSPIHLEGSLDDRSHSLDLLATSPYFVYDGNQFVNAQLRVSTPNDTLRTVAQIEKMDEMGKKMSLGVKADAINNKLSAIIDFDNEHDLRPAKGNLNLDARFFESEDGTDAAHIDIHPSNIQIGDSIWEIQPSNVVYRKDLVTVDHFAIRHDKQHVIVDGLLTKNAQDTLFVDLKDVNVSYILDLVDFDAVSFSGLATGKVYATGVFDKPAAAAHLTVNDFKFEDGRLGVLTADAVFNNEQEQIDIDAIANDEGGAYTTVKGYVSPQRDSLELHISPHHARLEFLESFCGSFMENVQARGLGDLTLTGALSELNLIGEAVVDGDITISSLNTTYTLHNDTVRLIPDHIIFSNDTIYDKEGHIGILSGMVNHESLTNLSYDLNVNAQNLLSYDFKDFGDDTFCGTVYGTGNCRIVGKEGEVTIDVDVTPNKGSQIVYNVASPGAINKQEFVRWGVRNDSLSLASLNDTLSSLKHHVYDAESYALETDLHINFLINATPSATLKLIMDSQSGDYITLNGDGVIRATYYNKGSFDMFGNYVVDHGMYKLTIQNVIKRDFQFQQGGSISFGGDPYQALLNLKALYTLNGVSLSDLSIGKSFSSNNIRVDCLMNITGTPASPSLEFDFDMPTVGSDAKQMIYSIVNSAEERNQQVLYLLAIGRFYNQNTNNASSENTGPYSQTSLAMQSILSGTISQQLNNVLSSVIKNNNWNFGANISTGDEGFNNAEYEGLLSGRLLNNRLLINGQFGYRDNVNATSSFIGDFDIRYLLYPNGNLAIKVYNQTNDRYFTRNSLTTQGVGLIMKKDFNGLSDLLGVKKKKKNKKKKK